MTNCLTFIQTEADDWEFKLDAPTIYSELAIHQREERWELQEPITILQAWTDRFNREFKLDIAELVIRIDKLPKRILGQHRRGYNGLGLQNEITISIEHLPSAEWDVLGTLLHELLHVWQDTHGRTPPGKKNEHNAELRAKAAECGLLIDEDGLQGYSPDSPFIRLLESLQVEVPIFFDGKPIRPDRQERKGKSKRTRYVCPCGQSCDATTTKGLFAHCDLCQGAFEAVERGKRKATVRTTELATKGA